MYTLALLASLVLSRTPHAESRVARYDVLEFNDYGGDIGSVRQAIAWDWSPTDGRHYAQWYAMLMERSDGSSLCVLSRTVDGAYRLRVSSHTVEAKSVRFTKTDHDPEVLDRAVFRQDQRRRARSGELFTFQVPVPDGAGQGKPTPTPVALPNWLQWPLGKAPVIEK